jgi:type II secretory pathway pseudopilin PulG
LWEVLLVIAVLAALLAILLPALAGARKRAKRINCINNLKQVGLAFKQWSLDNDDKFPMQVSITNGGTMELIGSGNVFVHFRVLSNELNTPKLVFCPDESDPKRRRASVFDAETSLGTGQIPFTNDQSVSYFVGVDATPDQPAMFLSGDANLTVSGKPGKHGLISLWTNSPVAWAKPLRPYHGEGGNIVLAGGTAHQVGDAGLRELLRGAGVATNRLAMP